MALFFMFTSEIANESSESLTKFKEKSKIFFLTSSVRTKTGVL